MNEIISKETQENYNNLINDTYQFINNTIESKYLVNNETCFENMIQNRIKDNLDAIEDNKTKLNRTIQLMLDKKFLPGGSILSGFGLTHLKKVTLSNCYYIPITEDSLDGIYDTKKQMVKVYSRRGGCGSSVTILRPKGCSVGNAAKYSTGAVSFMPGFSQDVHDIGQSGRRGAALLDIDCRHPDLLDFIWSKAKPEQVFEKDQYTNINPNINFLNISIQVIDQFMEAVINDQDWELFFPDTTFEKYDTEWNGDYDEWLSKDYPTVTYQTIKARDILKQISEANWLTGDPGLLFKNHAQQYSTGYFDQTLIPIGVNPCLPNWAPVLTPKGYTYFKDIKNDVLINNEKYNCSDLIETHKSADVYETELESGLKLYCTNNHLIQKVNGDFLEDVELNDLSINDKIKVDYNTVESPIDDDEYLRGYDDIHNEKNLYSKTFSYQMGFIHGFLERTDSFIHYTKNCLTKGVHLDYTELIEQIQTILTSINIYSELDNSFSEFTILNVYDLDKIVDRFTLDEDILTKFNEINENISNEQKIMIKQKKFSQKIKNIKKLDKQYPVYDIKVPSKNYFVSSACIVHNCG